eukprot:scaffold2048_cov204-Alexandrium_tamarense.AAC.20
MGLFTHALPACRFGVYPQSRKASIASAKISSWATGGDFGTTDDRAPPPNNTESEPASHPHLPTLLFIIQFGSCSSEHAIRLVGSGVFATDESSEFGSVHINYSCST